MEGVDAAVASWPASGLDTGPTRAATRVVLAADFLLLIVLILLCFWSLSDCYIVARCSLSLLSSRTVAKLPSSARWIGEDVRHPPEYT